MSRRYTRRTRRRSARAAMPLPSGRGLRSPAARVRRAARPPTTETRGPPERIDEQAEIARVANKAVNAGGDQGVLRLDRHQAAEPIAEHVDRLNPQCPADGEEDDSKPANGIAVDDPDLVAIGPSGQPGVRQSDHRKRPNDP